MSISLFMACNKDSNMDVSTTDPPASTSAHSSVTQINSTVGNPLSKPVVNAAFPAQANNTSGVTFQLLTLLPPGALVVWNTGYLTTTALQADGYYPVGNSEHALHFAAPTGKPGQTVQLFSPVVLGSVPVSPGSYNSMDFSLVLGQDMSAASFYLSGTCTLNGVYVPVQISVIQSLEMTAHWGNSVTINNNGQSYTASMTLDLAQVTNGITTQMLAAAQRSNGTIVISSNWNNNLYHLMLSNLQNDLQVKFN